MSLTSTEEWNETLSMLGLYSTTTVPNIILNPPKRHVTVVAQVVLTLVYITGVIGNVSALIILFHRDKRRNPKHLLMLRCLATNDLVALLGMLVQMYITIYVGSVISTRGFCSLRVVWRLFGLFSGCVAIVMAAERWLALTRPFVYQKVTYPMIVRCMLALWLIALALTSMPVLGFGLYYKGERCVRYREATEPSDVAYAYVWFVFGTGLCLSIVWCNLAVSRALSRLSRKAGALRRVTRSSSRAKPLLTIAGPPSEVVATAEERAFARLMAVLSISFVICWMPQMISIPLAQLALQLPQKAILARKAIHMFHVAADVLLCIHFTLDPYIYVLLRMPRPRFRLLKPLCKICWPDRSRSSSFTGDPTLIESVGSTGTTDHHGSSGDVSTPITEAPSTPVSEMHDPPLVAVSV
ncbi:prostaglandin E2 receptor EP3 subtype isoform X2 [Megalopta genalis]|uniref:prostaglandin E2 receptor EP3 subtype isoform X2 n=1 Tax=Megalopta genalis TaxID=115081 RepID=UPI0014431336|nr:prostaglandin E2 receptor EP3 subtype isoform X2 [Megalopta genalis]